MKDNINNQVKQEVNISSYNSLTQHVIQNTPIELKSLKKKTSLVVAGNEINDSIHGIETKRQGRIDEIIQSNVKSRKGSWMNNTRAVKTNMIDSQYNSKKKKRAQLFQAIKWKQLAAKWMAMTGFMRFKKLSFKHFNLIDDKAIVISGDYLPNSKLMNKQIVSQNYENYILTQYISSSKNSNMDHQTFRQSYFLSFLRYLKLWRSWKWRNQSKQFTDTNKDELQLKDTNIHNFIEEKIKNLFSVNNLRWCDDLLCGLPVFSPSGTFKFIWDLVILFVIVSFMFMVPLEITFGYSLTFMFHRLFLNLCISILIADFILVWNFGYFEKGLPITRRSQVAFNYLTNGLLIDIISSSFLFVDIVFSSQNQSSNYLHLLFFLKINSIQVIFKKIEERFHLMPKVTQITSLLQLLFLIISVTHIFGCMWIAVANYEMENGETTWISKVFNESSNWISKYICAFYYATVTMITVGYGDFSPVIFKNTIKNIKTNVYHFH